MTTVKNRFMTLGLLTGLGLMASCSDFGDQNINPNAAVTPVTSALLTEAMLGVPPTTATGALLEGIAGRLTTLAPEPRLFAQYWSESQYPENSLYATTFADWNRYYAVTLQDLQTIIDYNTDESTRAYVAQFGSNNNQLATARILKAYVFSVVTDRWGDVPYFNALKKQTQVEYDPQQAIYADLFKELKEASAQFDNGRAFDGDILFAGNATKWKKFANSLRMILALRLTKVDPATGRTEFTAAYNDAAGYISTNADNATIRYTDVNQFRNPDNALFDGRSDYGVSDVLVNKLESLSDPRLPAYATPTSTGDFVGLPYGLTRDLLIDYTNDNPEYALPSAKVLAKTQPSYIITASQMLLAKAEASVLGWISADARTAYNDAIRASWEQWGVYDAAKYTAYIASPNVAPTAGDILAKIGDQRWIALYPNGSEAWTEWRRTGYPNLQPTPYAVNESKQIPRRYGYPNTEPTLNTAAYEAAVGRLSNGDKTSSRVWWDKP
ncbi:MULTISPECIES: SusD/RagB family nutrient-binding outer membrane lipoprotein [Spirosoma]|uniref:SusD/RagB family nutrient-binding outer membrane lipoprotein n=1 Tax=Spirosoma sordidisoli TaxID=2502893 RepID=A0A4Q2UU83_9BACT|nr:MULTISPECIES: SusD/RagB family nutrient-binding outer membrane lipoprotein [Spirosoma]RYC71350.1 SusD/RagB family nutrient-binding outer membrane lipoprotein [Spirosoma sordidisoli]